MKITKTPLRKIPDLKTVEQYIERKLEQKKAK